MVSSYRPYLPGLTFDQFVTWASTHHPRLAARISPERYEVAVEAGIYDDDAVDVTFEDHVDGSRGIAYRATQLANPLIRARGIEELYQRATGGRPTNPEMVVLDALGGSGTVANAIGLLHRGLQTPTVITADVSAAMISAAIELNRAAVRQSAAYSLFADESVDAVIFAYGTHHIPVAQRSLAFSEAYRILRPHGRIVVQDFEIGTPTERWYSELLDTYTVTNHAHTHFTRGGMTSMVKEAGFTDVTVEDVYDPCIASSSSADTARIAMLRYLVNVFDLKLPRGDDSDLESWSEVAEILTPYAHFTDGPACLEATDFTVYPTGSSWASEFPRVALVAVGVKA